MVSSIFRIAIIALPSGIVTAGYLDEINREKNRWLRPHVKGLSTLNELRGLLYISPSRRARHILLTGRCYRESLP